MSVLTRLRIVIWAALSALRSRYFFAEPFPSKKMSSTQLGLHINVLI